VVRLLLNGGERRHEVTPPLGQHPERDFIVKEEEEDLFPKVEKKLGDDKLNELGDHMKARFAEVVAAGFQAAVPKGFAKTSSDLSLSQL
jgi:hypothetical protein